METGNLCADLNSMLYAMFCGRQPLVRGESACTFTDRVLQLPLK